MSSNVEVGEIKIVRFSTEWMDQYLDLAERNGSRDPMYPLSTSREEKTSKILRQISTGVIRAHFIAIHDGKLVGLARAVMPPTCGETEDRAILVLVISKEHRNLGVESALLEHICDELHLKNVKWIEMGTLDSWPDWQRFLEENDFEEFEKSAGLVLRANIPVHQPPPAETLDVRSVRFPEDRSGVVGLFRKERSEDAPRSCDIETPWWEVEPFASIFDPEGFLVAEERDTGEIVGFVDAWFYEENGVRADIGENEVARRYLGTRLREILLAQVISWLRKKGGKDIRARIHIGYRNEENLFKRLGFEVEYTASNWRKPTHS
jgi:GNAT superfamily N-acetyltransferase